MSAFWTLGLLLLLTVVEGFQADLQCHLDVQKCMEPVVNYTKSMQDGRFVPYMTEDEFNEFCRKYDEVDACMEAITCTNEMEKVLEGFDNAMEFMCEEEPEGYPTYARCITHMVVHSEMQKCNEAIQQIPHKDEACGAYNNYLHCGFRTLEEYCTRAEAVWFEKALVKSMEPLMQYIGCETDRPSSSGYSKNTGVIVGVAIAVILIVVIAIGAAFYFYRARRQVVKGYKVATNKPGIV